VLRRCGRRICSRRRIRGNISCRHEFVAEMFDRGRYADEVKTLVEGMRKYEDKCRTELGYVV